MSRIVTQISFLIFLVNVFINQNCIRAKKINDFHDKTSRNAVNNVTLNEVGAERLEFWDPKSKDKVSSGSRRFSRQKQSETWFDSRKRANQSDPFWNPIDHQNSSKNEMKPNNFLRSGTAVSTSIMSPNDTKRSRFGPHDGPRVRFSRSRSGRHGDKDISSTRIAPMQLMQQEGDQQQQQQQQQQGPKSILNDEEFILSPYQVVEQITTLLSGFEGVEFTTEVLGRTASYIDIILFKITKKGSNFFRARDSQFVENEVKEKKILFIVHVLSPMGIAHMFSLTFESYLQKLLGYYLEHLDKFDIYFIPIANPDGYLRARISSWEDGMKVIWNKNVAINADCPGVNVDRNFDVAWNFSERVSSCSQHYPGEAPFSEPESRAVRDVLHRVSHKIAAYFHVHSGTYSKSTFKGDALLYPKGYSDHQTDDDKYVDLRGEIDETIRNANFKVLSVTVDTLYNWYGRVSGTSVDYAATVYGIPYAMELVMQLYVDNYDTFYRSEIFSVKYIDTAQYAALTEVWKRVINVTFTNIYNKIEGNDNNK